MKTASPALLAAALRPLGDTAPPKKLRSPPGSLHYPRQRRSRGALAVAILFSTALHVGILFDFSPRRKNVPRPVEPEIMTLRLVPVEVKELEEPEPKPEDEVGTATDLSAFMPMLPDSPQILRADDFIQPLDFSSLVERPDFSASKIFTIPENRGSGKIGKGIRDLFNLADLDRAPEPIFQPVPTVPHSLKSDSATETVLVEFIVNTQGRVINPCVGQSTNYRFDDTAIKAVARWTFKPGIKAGRKVNTRMAVPIIFKVMDDGN
jgi:periplasmic protein TonB